MRITAPVNNNKHHPKCYALTDRLWSYRILCSGSRILGLHPIPLSMATDCSSKQQKQLNCCMPQAEDRHYWGSIHQLWKLQGLSGRQSIALTAEQGHIFLSSALSTTKFLPTSLTRKSFHTPDLEIILIWAIHATHLYLRKRKILRWKWTCCVLSHSVSLHLYPVSDTYRAGNKTDKKSKSEE